MPLPLLDYDVSAQNQRVNGFEVPGDEQPRIFDTESLLTSIETDALIHAAYRQIFHEQQMLAHNRERFLESQLRSNQLTVREFIRGLLLSDSFRRLLYESNNNYRFAEICIQRVLGRNIYDDREKLAWSIVLATKGLQGFVDELLNSAEYLSNFGDTIVPYQRRRILPQHAQGEVTFEHMARYGTDYRDKLPEPSPVVAIIRGYEGASNLNYLRWDWQKNPPKSLQTIWLGLFYTGMGVIALMFLSILLGL
ncbi:MAG: phycobilisome rod-core linker polypeptide [Cyanobacteria bacterium P01_D01_bin.105]